MERLLEPTLTWHDGAFQRDLRVAVDASGRIAAVGRDLPGDPERLEGALLPGFVNAHSHAFQFGLRGVAETFPKDPSTFWGWREAMYELVDTLDVDRCRELSTAAFREMLGQGFTSVGEFHYVRHAGSGPGDRHALDRAVLDAATEVGIRLRLLPACYLTGDIGAPLAGAQSRFDAGSVDDYLHRLDALAEEIDDPRHVLGIVAHSVRAVAIEDIVRLHRASLERGLPFHIHLEEAPREIETCRAVHGTTPMRLLLDHGVVSDNVVAVHCTHTEPDDMRDYAAAGGQVCLCPVTEANLGDGIADLPVMCEAGASLSVGTDLNSRTDPFEELRWLEYVQRLAREGRGVLRGESGDVGTTLLEIGTRGGAHALGLDAGRIETGCWADLILVDHRHPSLAGARDDQLAAALVLAGRGELVTRVLVGGVDR
ncbi:MAG: formimidoylglutamate deiminase [Phycisphaerales bacterium]|nr:formimidoylglutamate deiminase [Phycisphaerales bacterium]